MNIKKTLAIKEPDMGRIILDLRLAFGLTQEQFAANLGVTHTTINVGKMDAQGQDLLVKYLSN